MIIRNKHSQKHRRKKTKKSEKRDAIVQNGIYFIKKELRELGVDVSSCVDASTTVAKFILCTGDTSIKKIDPEQWLYDLYIKIKKKAPKIKPSGYTKAKNVLRAEYHTSKHPPAIYQIISLATKKRYVGSSVKPDVRFKMHMFSLENNMHDNYRLQRDFKLYGKNNFELSILWTPSGGISREELYDKEQEYINRVHPEYNIELIVSRPKKR